MAIFSKPLRLDCSCYELGHCWTPYCLEATPDIAKDVFREAVKIYGTLYLITAILRKKNLNYYARKLLPEIFQSSLFLTVNGTMFIALFCIWRKLVGYYIFYNTFICGIPACALSLLIERKDRRGPLAVYLTNLAAETGFRMLVNRGIVRPIENGEVILFSLTSAVYLYLLRKQDGLPKSTLSVFKFLVGSEELPVTEGPSDNFSRTVIPTAEVTSLGDHRATPASSWWATIVQLCLQHFAQGVAYLKNTPRHGLCRHKYGCLHYVLQGFFKMFSLGYLVQSSIKLLSTLPNSPSKMKDVLRSLLTTHNMGLGMFLGLYSAVFRTVNCSLRWLRQKDEAIHGMVAGFLAGSAMYFYKSVTVTLYSAAKLGEILYFMGIKAGWLPHMPCADVLIYAFSTAFVFHAAVLEPHALRPAYWKFLLRVTNNKFAGMNRKLLDIFGVQSSKLYPDYWPNYDPRFTNLVKSPT